ncbi:farnesyl cysteine-carboxyl methyltransferase [Dispira parvispora]|uniref:Protein-S-isoprenylcysteine O-methyltransferase n=1 Tax=Dispira parvispora TaxID=1520584 RepID=A0A9W8AR92_9FUNG|nr:farnesyl cysteine-carboxyl methyltransferase [Dispira parvispora]
MWASNDVHAEERWQGNAQFLRKNPSLTNRKRTENSAPSDFPKGTTEATTSGWHGYQPVVPLGDGSHSPQNVALTSFFLGVGAGVGAVWFGWVCLSSAQGATGWMSSPPSFIDALANLGFALLAVSCYHFLEYIVTVLYNPTRASYDSFMFSPDPEGRFLWALGVALLEFLVEAYYAPWLKLGRLTWYMGIGFMILGQMCRSLAMITASQSFNHYIAEYKTTDHVLITHGIYRFVRHPSYLGFFLWAVGLQIYLANPISWIGYVIVLSKFFYDRIPYEEEYLVQFFGEDYVNYKATTAALVPFLL